MEQQENHRDGEQGCVMIDQGWGDLSPASPSRFYSTSCWRPWGEAEMFSSAGDFSQCAESVGDGWDTFDGADAELSEPACDAETDRKAFAPAVLSMIQGFTVLSCCVLGFLMMH